MPEPAATAPDASRVGVSTISFRHRPLEEALSIISALGATEVDLGAIPAVVGHVPVPFTGDPGAYVAVLDRHALRAGAVNADVGDLNDPTLTPERLTEVAAPLADLAAAVGGALIVPGGRASWEPFQDEENDLAVIAENLHLLAGICAERGVRLQVELLHHLRYVHSVERARKVLDAVGDETFGLLFDVSHVVASDDDPVGWLAECASRVERVHLRDAIPGNLNLGIGRGQVDFAGVIASLETSGFSGSYILELETHDVAEDHREADAARSRAEILTLLGASATVTTPCPAPDPTQEGTS
ncbi:sugar phosphate isomerase/epimerase [Nesterenkonia sp. CL21]|uniref:sugar phosphate isomerase/epimerase family protein n=1 Tax=Nesterenkonia sp. CL21 TaxID=3064894 RepID=UPI00287A7118|nr:sugar phosphate isomerase/epimerase [Nesterenkonia sp. CL21]MDS2173184.1 sugar phosphate isomerase/epimerase [Nesterenkonia sp. CL21]